MRDTRAIPRSERFSARDTPGKAATTPLYSGSLFRTFGPGRRRVKAGKASTSSEGSTTLPLPGETGMEPGAVISGEVDKLIAWDFGARDDNPPRGSVCYYSSAIHLVRRTLPRFAAAVNSQAAKDGRPVVCWPRRPTFSWRSV